MKRNYDTVASFYDRFARLIFGRAQLHAQSFLLQAIRPDSDILIIGGGTGWILEELAERYASDLRITFVDASEKMIAQARERNCGGNEVTFLTGYIQDMNLSKQFDFIMTPFLFDNLDQRTTGIVCDVINQKLKSGGQWLYCDFEGKGSWWQRLMLGSMYLFFRTMCGIEAKWMPDMTQYFAAYQLRAERKFYTNFIIARVYGKL